MGNIAVINGLQLSGHSLVPLGGGGTAVLRVEDWARSLPAVGRVVWLIHQDWDEPLPADSDSTIRRPHWGERELMETLSVLGDGHEVIFYAFGDAPLLDLAYSHTIYENHRRYYAQYSFADGYPYGLAPEIISTEILGQLIKLSREDSAPVDRGTIYTVVSRDINSFDIETDIAPRDLRLLRISLTTDNARNYKVVEKIFDRWTDPPNVVEISDYLEKNQELLRTLPAFGEIQITNRLSQRVTYLPDYPGSVYSESEAKYMSLENFSMAVEKLQTLSGGNMTINLGFRGEPAYHPNLDRLCELLLAKQNMRILLETSGIGWDESILNSLSKMDHSRIDWIVCQDSVDEQHYSTLRGAGFNNVNEFIPKILELFPGRVWIQATRLSGHEDSLEQFYRYWKERGDNAIIQKYDNYCGVLPERKVTDLSPLSRNPCWHLKRDIPILIDGTVLSCREDLTGDSALGNIFLQTPELIWQRGEPLYLEHLKGNYPGICARCDEYYTFNY